MRNRNNRHLGVELDPALHHISKYYSRSENGQIFHLIRQAIKALATTGDK